jgi:hypothetical protein
MANQIQLTTRDIAWFNQINKQEQLHMKPPFQRNLVWTSKQKSFLIDSILNSYPVPELYMQELVNEHGDKTYVVVDGQQRITACLEFIQNLFQVNGKDSPSYADMTFDDLTIDQKKIVFNYTFVVRVLPEMSDKELREIFSRLNRNNVVLNPQELRQATYWGEFIQTMNSIAEEETWRDLKVFTTNDVKRMLDVEFISELTIALLHGVQNKKLTLNRYYEAYEDEFPEASKIKFTFELVNRELIALLPADIKTRWSKKTDFYSLFVLLGRKRHLLPFSEEKRKIGRDLLLEIGQKIDEFVSIDAEHTEPDPMISQYGLNLRASSDLGARKKREEALEALLQPIFT